MILLGVKTGHNLKDDRSPEEIGAEALHAAGNDDIVLFIGGLNNRNN